MKTLDPKNSMALTLDVEYPIILILGRRKPEQNLSYNAKPVCVLFTVDWRLLF